MFTQNKTHPCLQAAPGILFLAFFPGRCARDRHHEKKKEKRADSVDDVNAGKTNVGDDEAANGRANNRADLKNAAIPGDSIGESVPRHQRREK